MDSNIIFSSICLYVQVCEIAIQLTYYVLLKIQRQVHPRLLVAFRLPGTQKKGIRYNICTQERLDLQRVRFCLFARRISRHITHTCKEQSESSYSFELSPLVPQYKILRMPLTDASSTLPCDAIPFSWRVTSITGRSIPSLVVLAQSDPGERVEDEVIRSLCQTLKLYG